MSLEQKLIQAGLITKEDVFEAKKAAGISGKSFWIELIRLKKISERALIVFFSNSLKIPFVELYSYKINFETLALIDESVLRQHMVLPMYKIDGILGLAMVNPGDVVAIDEISRITGCNVEPLLCSLNDMRYTLDRYYGNEDIVGRLAEFVAAAYEHKDAVAPETRFEKRVTANLRVEINIESEPVKNMLEGIRLSAKTVNISAGGMLLLFDLTYFIPNGTLVKLDIKKEYSTDFSKIFRDEEEVSLSGRIVSFQGMDENSYRIGISFIDIPDNIKENIRQFADDAE